MFKIRSSVHFQCLIQRIGFMSYINAVVDSLWFGRQIRAMRSRVKILYKKIEKAKRSESHLESEANRCAEKLQKLLDYARVHPVMSSTDWKIADETLSELREIRQLLRKKRPRWRKMLDFVKQTIKLMLKILKYVSPVIPILPSGVREPLLAIAGTLDGVKRLLPPAD